MTVPRKHTKALSVWLATEELEADMASYKEGYEAKAIEDHLFLH